jgi:hypothetical protein
MGKIIEMYGAKSNKNLWFYLGRSGVPVPYSRRNLFHLYAHWRNHVRH